MNPLPVFFVLPVAEAVAAPAAGGLETGTVLLGLLIVAVAWLASSVSNLRTEVAALKEALAVPPKPVVAAPSLPVPAGPTSDEVAVIAAAVHCLFGANARVVAVVPPSDHAQAWSREGRREVFQSHQIR
ncbi:hypothetical protein ESB00_16365 [Oleiharenicola lentus]|uniref:Sodium pump decarboxylase subunit gamma n=1 Tax=Oleiharenicola lentus TaxID=2508720 RepID=A0A4Q1C4F6_9BACT|nr:OadG family protein [Oleiharenicola lentus]RXK53272.1 hypothetical protein ESB00_16365 [Oleiharenicola lentus]